MIHASGCFFLSNTTGNICLQLRSTTSNHPKTWAFWGGKSEEGEQPIDVLLREIEEEVGFVPMIGKIYPLHTFTSQDNTFIYHTYVATVPTEFHPKLNEETGGYCWCSLDCVPKPLHYGAKYILLNRGYCDKIRTIYDNSKDSIIMRNFAKELVK